MRPASWEPRFAPLGGGRYRVTWVDQDGRVQARGTVARTASGWQALDRWQDVVGASRSRAEAAELLAGAGEGTR